MNIVYFYQYFGTPKGGWSTRVYETIRRWARQGHHVTVVTSLYDKSELEILAARYDLRNLHFLGLIPKEEVVGWLKNARAAFYTVKDVPVIQASKGWIGELLEGENCGLNVPLGDAAAMADAVERLCDDETFFHTCAKNAKRLAQTRFDRGHLAEAYLEALQGLEPPTKGQRYVPGHGS